MKRVFISCCEEQLGQARILRVMAANPKFDLEFYDESLRGEINSVNAPYIKSKIREKIKRASITLCLVGPQTCTSKWVAWELETSIAEGNRLIAMYIKGINSAFLPKVLSENKVTCALWDLDTLNSLVGS